MRFVFLLAFGGFILEAIARPQQSVGNEGEEERSQYEGTGELAEDYLSDKSVDELNLRGGNRENTITSRKSGSDKPHSNIISFAQPPQSNNQYENFGGRDTEYRKSNIVESQINKEDQSSLSERRQVNPNLNHDEIEEEEDDAPQDEMESHPNHNKRNNDNSVQKSEESILASNEEDNTFYDDRRFINDKSEYNNDPRDVSKQQQIQIRNSFDGRRDTILKRKPDTIFLRNRDRRQASSEQNEKANVGDTKSSETKSDGHTGEDNESAIKRNIKKLSREELEDLFNSLSDDKKALLKKVIDNKIESVNKREITKKAGAVEENNYIESGQSDLSKIESGRSLEPSPSASASDTTETTKQTEINEVSSSKNSEAESGSAKSDSKNELIVDNLQNLKQETEKEGENLENNIEPKNEINIQEMTKNENKREISTLDSADGKSDVSNEELSIDTRYALNNDMDCSKDDSWSELMKDESELHNAYSNLYKRDADSYAKSVNIKSLEESFPNYEFVESKPFDSKLAPLIRVKRTNNNIVKRGTDYCTNLKVPFFPIALEDGIDDAEKSEFDDGGIFEKASNYEKVGKRNRCVKTDQDNINNYNQRSNYKRLKAPSVYSKIDSESNSANIGSDTDNILSNVEGVDENLMFNNGLRKKRISDDSKLNDEISNIDNNDLISKLPPASVAENDKDEIVQNSFNYRDTDAFGPISQSSETELSRFKRIRRLKPSPAVQSNI